MQDDDQAFVESIVEAVINSDFVDWQSVETNYTDDGRDAAMTLELEAGDRYRITIEEVHS